jgi:signal transduction histidine kinase
MPENDKLQFEASAYLQTLIGRELIRTKEAAVVELAKNCYDSGARSVLIRITPRTEKNPDSIEIVDDGSGMDLPQIRKVFMVAGYSERPTEAANERVPTGEKGIGRFASDRLGTRLLVESKTVGRADGIVVDIDWRAFGNRKKRFNEIFVPYYRQPITGIPKEASGTRLTITGLREEWNHGALASLRTVLEDLFNPFEMPSGFVVTLDVVGSSKLSGPIQSAPLEAPDFDLRFSIDQNGALDRKIRARDAKPEVGERTIPEGKLLAGLKGRFYYYVKRPPRALVHGRPPGVFVYRDGFRVEPFGTSRADWLGIGERRAKLAGHAHIVPTRLFGFISISRTKHARLQDTTSREALIDTDQARALVHVLRTELIDFLEEHIRLTVAVPRWAESRARKAIQLKEARFQALSVMSSGVAHELRQPLQVIRMDADSIERRLCQLGIDDPLIDAARRSIDTSIERIDQRIQLISALATGTKLDINERANISQVVEEECEGLRSRAGEASVEIVADAPRFHTGVVSEALVRMVVKNMVQNAINALAKVEDDRRRRVRVWLSGTDGTHLITVEDNAMGVPRDVREKLFDKFATETTGGMGVGLYICRLLLGSHDGDITYVTQEGVGSTFTAKFVDQEISNATPDTGSR